MRNILVIGASGDIGKAIVKQMAEADDHASFILHYNQNKGAIHECVQSLRDDAVLQVIQADLTTQEGAASLIEQIHFPIKEADRKSTRLNSSHVSNSYAVFCLKKKTQNTTHVSK